MLFSYQPHEDWSGLQKWSFRFVALYCWGYIVLMFGGNRILEPLLVWAGRDILGMEGRLEFFATGSGDTSMAFASLFVLLCLSLIGTVIWSALDRKRPSYNAAFYWLTVVLRIFLVFFMLRTSSWR